MQIYGIFECGNVECIKVSKTNTFAAGSLEALENPL